MRSIVGDIENGTLTTEAQLRPSPGKSSVEEGESDPHTSSTNDGPTTDEIGALHGQLGCLMVDSAGKYRKHIFTASKKDHVELTFDQDMWAQRLIYGSMLQCDQSWKNMALTDVCQMSSRH